MIFKIEVWQIDINEYDYSFVMPSSETFSLKPVKKLLQSYIKTGMVIIDPFARNAKYGTYTNDLNPNTEAQYHLKAVDFLQLIHNKGIKADVILFDPPYTLGQTKECYQSIGITEFTQADAQNVWRQEKDLCQKILKIGGHFIHFGFHSNGCGYKRGFTEERIMLLRHGRVHNDTIILVERKISEQLELL